jgi:hypothetical protein
MQTIIWAKCMYTVLRKHHVNWYFSSYTWTLDTIHQEVFYRSLSQSVRFCQHCPDHPPALSLPSSRSKPLTGVTTAWQSGWKKDLSLGNQPTGNQDGKSAFTGLWTVRWRGLLLGNPHHGNLKGENLSSKVIHGPWQRDRKISFTAWQHGN